MRSRTFALAFLLAAAPATAQPPLPGADGTVCDFIAANAGRDLNDLRKDPDHSFHFEPMITFADMLTKVASADIDGDGDVEVLGIIPHGRQGSMGGELPFAYGARQSPDDPFHADDFGALGARFMSWRGDTYVVYFEDEKLEQAAGAVAVTGKPGIACTFKGDFEETFNTVSQDPAIRAAYDTVRATHASWVTRMEGDPLTENDRRYLMGAGFGNGTTGRKWETEKDLRDFNLWISKASSVRAADIDHDGDRERMVFVRIQRDNGRGCAGFFLELLPEEGEAAPDPELLAMVRKFQGVDWSGYDPAPCGSHNDLIEVNGKGYLLANRLGSSGRVRALYYIENGDWNYAMRSVFTPTHKVTFDREKGRPQ